MKKILTPLLAVLATSFALAQGTPSTDGEVRKIDRDAKKITLKHGPISNLDMPAMTMVFQVRDAALLDNLAVGDKIRFAVQQQQGAYVITAVEKPTK